MAEFSTNDVEMIPSETGVPSGAAGTSSVVRPLTYDLSSSENKESLLSTPCSIKFRLPLVEFPLTPESDTSEYSCTPSSSHRTSSNSSYGEEFVFPSDLDDNGGHSAEFLAVYRVFGELASGNGGTVFECRKYTAEELASLTVSGTIPSSMLARGDLSETRLVAKRASVGSWEHSALQNEIAFLEILKDASKVVKMMRVETFADNLYLILKKYRYDLYSFLHEQRERGPLDYRSIIIILRQVLMALSSMHAKGIIHRDLKLENVLLNGINDVVLADLGSAVTFEHRRTPKDYGWSGTIHTNAPEMLARVAYCEAVDIWSCGALALELLTGEVSYLGGQKLSATYQLKNILNKLSVTKSDIPHLPPEPERPMETSSCEAGGSSGEIPIHQIIVPQLIRNLNLPPEMEYVLTKMLAVNWCQRPEADELLAMPIFKNPPSAPEQQEDPMTPCGAVPLCRRIVKSE